MSKHSLLTIETNCALGQYWASAEKSGANFMAYIEKRTHASGKITYRACIRLNGAPDISESFPTRWQAKEWSAKMESDVRQGRYFGSQTSKERTFDDLLNRYLTQEAPQKSFEKYKKQLLWWKRHLKDFYLCNITSSTISEVKEQLLKEKTPRRGPLDPNLRLIGT
jgi:hypothetical protein